VSGEPSPPPRPAFWVPCPEPPAQRTQEPTPRSGPPSIPSGPSCTTARPSDRFAQLPTGLVRPQPYQRYNQLANRRSPTHPRRGGSIGHRPKAPAPSVYSILLRHSALRVPLHFVRKTTVPPREKHEGLLRIYTNNPAAGAGKDGLRRHHLRPRSNLTTATGFFAPWLARTRCERYCPHFFSPARCQKRLVRPAKPGSQPPGLCARTCAPLRVASATQSLLLVPPSLSSQNRPALRTIVHTEYFPFTMY